MLGQAMKAMGDIIYKLLFENSALGGALKKVLEFICQIVYWVVNDVWKAFFCPIFQKTMPPILNAVVSAWRSTQESVGFLQDFACFFGFCFSGPVNMEVRVRRSCLEKLVESHQLQGPGEHNASR